MTYITCARSPRLLYLIGSLRYLHIPVGRYFYDLANFLIYCLAAIARHQSRFVEWSGRISMFGNNKMFLRVLSGSGRKRTEDLQMQRRLCRKMFVVHSDTHTTRCRLTNGLFLSLRQSAAEGSPEVVHWRKRSRTRITR